MRFPLFSRPSEGGRCHFKFDDCDFPALMNDIPTHSWYARDVSFAELTHYPGRIGSHGPNKGFDFGSLPGWRLESNAAPRIECPPQIPDMNAVPLPSTSVMGLALLVPLMSRRLRRKVLR